MEGLLKEKDADKIEEKIRNEKDFVVYGFQLIAKFFIPGMKNENPSS